MGMVGIIWQGEGNCTQFLFCDLPDRDLGTPAQLGIPLSSKCVGDLPANFQNLRFIQIEVARHRKI